MIGQQACCESHTVIRKLETNEYLRSHSIKKIKMKGEHDRQYEEYYLKEVIIGEL